VDTDAPYRETRQQPISTVKKVCWRSKCRLHRCLRWPKCEIAVVAHVSNATDHEGESFNRGSEKEGNEILTAICRAGLIAPEAQST
jgi:hypothetical protein